MKKIINIFMLVLLTTITNNALAVDNTIYIDKVVRKLMCRKNYGQVLYNPTPMTSAYKPYYFDMEARYVSPYTNISYPGWFSLWAYWDSGRLSGSVNTYGSILIFDTARNYLKNGITLSDYNYGVGVTPTNGNERLFGSDSALLFHPKDYIIGQSMNEVRTFTPGPGRIITTYQGTFKGQYFGTPVGRQIKWRTILLWDDNDNKGTYQMIAYQSNSGNTYFLNFLCQKGL